MEQNERDKEAVERNGRDERTAGRDGRDGRAGGRDGRAGGREGGAVRRIVVGASGASGTPLLISCLRLIRQTEGYESHLVMSDGAKLTARQEAACSIEEIEALADVVHDNRSLGAAIASGTFPTEGMVVAPCSMKTVAGICSGYSDNLLLRAADVTVKEQRPLVLAARESPLSAIHLRNLHELSLIPGVRIVPPMLSFYHDVSSVEMLVDRLAARLLAPFGIRSDALQPWEGM